MAAALGGGPLPPVPFRRVGTDTPMARLLRKLLATDPADRPTSAAAVDAILADPVFQKHLTSLLLCATDPVAAWGGVKRLQETYGLTPTAITGPATDNESGSRVLRESTGLPAVNALTHPERLTDAVFGRMAPAAGGA